MTLPKTGILLNKYFDLCRGKNALELTKWFNTNYHYLVPVISSPDFKVVWNKLQAYKENAKCQMLNAVPSVIGPFTFLKLAKGLSENKWEDYFIALAYAYKELLNGFPACRQGRDEVFIEEPAFVLELQPKEIELIKKGYAIIGEAKAHIALFTFYDSVDFLKVLYELPIDAIGLDFINGKENFEGIKKLGFPEDKSLIAGVVNGRNVWKADISKTIEFLEHLHKYAKNIDISNASPLYHLPVSLEGEELDSRFLNRLSFAQEKLEELNTIARTFNGQGNRESLNRKSLNDYTSERLTNFGANKEVQDKISALTPEDFIKLTPYSERAKLQKKVLNLPLFPTTTIGSYPQTAEVRGKRNDFIKGRIEKTEYKGFINGEITKLIKFQEEVWLRCIGSR